MPTAIELSSSAVRLVQIEAGRLVQLTQWPVAADADPFRVLAAAPVPPGLGRVRLVLQHDDMLLRPMLQPPCPPDRLDRIVRFELQTGASDDPVAIAWHQVEGLGGDDLRVLALVAKEQLIAQARTALAAHGAQLAALVPTPLALYHAWLAQVPATERDAPAVLLDAGGRRLHICLVDQGGVRFLRSVAPGLDELVRLVADLRGVDLATARTLVAGMGGDLPEDLRGLVDRQAGVVATAIANNLRFAKAQLKLDCEPTTLWLAGAGGQAPGFAADLARRLSWQVRILNPFAGLTHGVDDGLLDAQAALPSPWAAACGAAQAPAFILDGLADERGRRARFWMGDGALRVGVGIAAGLMAAAIATAIVVGGRASAAATELGTLTQAATTLRATVSAAETETTKAAAQVRWLDGEHRAARIAGELIAALAAEQDPAVRHVALDRYRVARVAGSVQVELIGTAKASAGMSVDKVLIDVEERLRRRYPAIASIERRATTLSGQTGALPFNCLLTIPDRTD
jgi:hypothetical protein